MLLDARRIHLYVYGLTWGRRLSFICCEHRVVSGFVEDNGVWQTYVQMYFGSSLAALLVDV